MTSTGITADQARANTAQATVSIEKLLAELSNVIDVNSKAGATSVVQLYAKERIPGDTLSQLVASLQSRGFHAVPEASTPGFSTLTVTWMHPHP